MSEFINLEITETIVKNEKVEIYRAVDKNDSLKKIIKAVPITNEFHSDVINLKNEFDILKYLSSEVLLKVYEFGKYGRGFFLTYEDIGGISLKQFLQNGKLSISDFYIIATKLSETISEIHRKKVIHKDIKPENIIINHQEKNIKIIDFGISTRLSKEETKWSSPNLFQGSIQYISPEQTGRMNRSVDYRSDFYSLGVTFYYLLVGKLPFENTDLLELIHSHLAKTPVPVHAVNREIPQHLSKIIEKLMAKTAENRYQTANGLKNDLEISKNSNFNHEFTLGEKDLSDEFKIQQRLYGRAEDILNLIDSFSEMHENAKSKLVLISGYSGVGKTSLVKEINKPITESKGYFITAKYDQYNRNLPFSAIIDVFTNLIRLFLTESPEKILSWKEKIQFAVGSNGKILTDVIPDLTLIIGEQTGVAELGAQESLNRFYLVFQNFIKVLCSFEHPLAIFLDDLQWADSASLSLIKNLMLDYSNSYLFLILAYRDNETDLNHPFIKMLDSLKEEGLTSEIIRLNPLGIEHIQELLKDSLHTSFDSTKDLADLVFQKTGGNPFFISELLKQLVKDDAIYFDYDELKWKFDLEKIKSTKISENVVELLIDRIQKLSDKTQNILKLASCIGNHFDLATLSLINQSSPKDTAKELEEAIAEELIYPVGDSYRLVDSMGNELKDMKKNIETARSIGYHFQHDRIQQASYELLDEDKKKKLRWNIGKILVKNSSELEEKIFDIVNHLNIGREYISEEIERITVAKLNLKVSKKAQISTAYESALNYIKIAISLLKTNDWNDNYDICSEIYFSASELYDISGNFLESSEIIQTYLNNVKTGIEKSNAYSILILQNIKNIHYEKAIEHGKTALKELNFHYETENVEMVINEETNFINQKYPNLESIEQIYSNPDLESETDIAILKILSNIGIAAYLSGKINHYVMIALLRVNLSIKKGNHPYSAVALTEYSLTLCAPGTYKRAQSFGEMGVKLVQKWGSFAYFQKSNSFHVFANFVSPWNKHIKESEKFNQEGYEAGLDSGNLIYAGYILLNQPLNLFYTGAYLKVIAEKINTNIEFTKKSKDNLALNTLYATKFVVDSILGQLKGNEIEFERQKEEEKDYWTLCIYKTLKSFVLLLEGKLTEAEIFINDAKEKLIYVPGLATISTSINFFQSMVLVRNFKEYSKDKKVKSIEVIKSNQKQLKILAENCPENYLHKYLLVEAELARIEYKNWKAAKFYDEAIQEAKLNGFIPIEGLANELAGRFWFNKKNYRFAQDYLKESFRCFNDWGAYKKANLLKEEFPNLVSDTQVPYDFTKTISGTMNLGHAATQLHTTAVIDLQSILRSSSAISSEIKLESLLNKIMDLVIENTGATRGVLIIKRENHFFVEAVTLAQTKETKILKNTPLEGYQELPISIIYFVQRTKENRVLINASTDEKFNKDFYITKNQTKSVLCTPIIKQGELTGVLYLENNLSIGAFTEDRLQVVNLLSSQAAISIDNAILYENMEQKVRDRTSELAQKNDELGEKNKHITDSIYYAKTIQEAMLPSKTNISNSLKDFFISFYPKDIVSGDFYWFAEVDGYIFIAAVDCTGHGVPGAFMSMIGSSILNQIVKEQKVFDPCEILSLLNKNIRKALKQDIKEDASRDGMEIAFCRIDPSNQSLIFSGGHRPLYYVQNGEFLSLKGDKEGIGGKQKSERIYTNQEVSYKDKKTVFYLTTDGFQDQPNLEGKKIGSRGLQEIIMKYHSLDGLSQRVKIDEELTSHTYFFKEPQRDDITIIGIIV